MMIKEWKKIWKSIFQTLLERLISFIYGENAHHQNLPLAVESIS